MVETAARKLVPTTYGSYAGASDDLDDSDPA